MADSKREGVFFTEHAASLCKTYADKSDELQDEFRRQSLRCE